MKQGEQGPRIEMDCGAASANVQDSQGPGGGGAGGASRGQLSPALASSEPGWSVDLSRALPWPSRPGALPLSALTELAASLSIPSPASQALDCFAFELT